MRRRNNAMEFVPRMTLADAKIILEAVEGGR